MSEIDYQRLFENGQLVWSEEPHRKVLDHFYRAFRGTKSHEDSLFETVYKAYVTNCHPEESARLMSTVVVDAPVAMTGQAFAVPEFYEPVMVTGEIVEPPQGPIVSDKPKRGRPRKEVV